MRAMHAVVKELSNRVVDLGGVVEAQGIMLGELAKDVRVSTQVSRDTGRAVDELLALEKSDV